MAYERTWAASFDNLYYAATALSLSQYQLWAMKATLCGELGGLTLGLWSVYSSCDGTTAGNADGPGTDRWGSTFDAAKLVRAAAGVAHSWIVLKSPTIAGSVWYFTIDFSGASDAIANFVFSKTAPSAGTTTARPTSANEHGMGQTGGSLNAGGTLQLLKSSLLLSSVGDFVFFTSIAGSGRSDLAISIINPVGCSGSDTWPFWTFKNYNTAPGAFTAVSMNTTTMASRTTAGAIGSVTVLTAAVSMGNVYQPDMLTGKMLTLPPYCIVNATSGGTWHARGRLPDIFVVPSGSSNIDSGMVLRDANGVITHFNLTQLWLPAPGGVIPNLY